MRTTASVLVLSLCTVLASGARAESAADAEEATRAEAREHAARARRAFEVGHFEEALEEYTRAYEVAPAPGVLFNMAQCHRQLGNFERALFFFRGYLRASPDAPNRALVEELIAESERELAAAEASAEARAEEARIAAEEDRRMAEAERRAAESERARAAEARRTAEEEAARAAAERTPPFYRTWWFWTIIGVVVAGGAAAGTAVGLTYEPETVLPGGSLGTIDGR